MRLEWLCTSLRALEWTWAKANQQTLAWANLAVWLTLLAQGNSGQLDRLGPGPADSSQGGFFLMEFLYAYASLCMPMYHKFTYSLSFICHVSYAEQRTTRARVFTYGRSVPRVLQYLFRLWPDLLIKHLYYAFLDCRDLTRSRYRSSLGIAHA